MNVLHKSISLMKENKNPTQVIELQRDTDYLNVIA